MTHLEPVPVGAVEAHAAEAHVADARLDDALLGGVQLGPLARGALDRHHGVVKRTALAYSVGGRRMRRCQRRADTGVSLNNRSMGAVQKSLLTNGRHHLHDLRLHGLVRLPEVLAVLHAEQVVHHTPG